MKTQTVKESIKQFTDAWNKVDGIQILNDLEKCCTAESTYADPLRQPTKGLEKHVAIIQASQDQMSGRIFTQIGEIDFHHNSGRRKWLLTQTDGSKVEGMTYFEYNDDNLITRIVGFFDPN